MIPIKRHCQFLLDKEKDLPDAKLRFRVRWGKNIAAFNVGYRVTVERWSPETQRCKNGTSHGFKKVAASFINREIERYSVTYEKVFSVFESENRTPSRDEFRDEFNRAIGNESKVSSSAIKTSFFDVFDLFTLTMGAQNNWTKATFTKFGAIRLHLHNFNQNLSLSSFTDETLQSFVTYQHRIKLRNTTISKNLDFVRWFLRWASGKNYYNGKSHETFRAKLKGTDGNSKEIIYLTWDELINLYNFDFTNATKTLPDESVVQLEPENKKALERVRDVFCFCCFTGLRYSDVAKLSRSDVRDNYISFVTLKTIDGLKIELNKYSKAILDKYIDWPFDKNKALPVISNAQMNLALKDMGEIAGLKDPQRIVYFMGNKRHEEVYPKYKLLTTHCGRRTFVVNALLVGIPSEIIMKFTGHSDFDSMKPYFKIVNKLKEDAMKKFDTYKPETINEEVE